MEISPKNKPYLNENIMNIMKILAHVLHTYIGIELQ